MPAQELKALQAASETDVQCIPNTVCNNSKPPFRFPLGRRVARTSEMEKCWFSVDSRCVKELRIVTNHTGM